MKNRNMNSVIYTCQSSSRVFVLDVNHSPAEQWVWVILAAKACVLLEVSSFVLLDTSGLPIVCLLLSH
jgi:hypothetical protein